MILEFDSLTEYEEYFRLNKLQISREIVKSIEDSFEKNFSEAIPFKIVFSNIREILYEISVGKEDWVDSIDACMKIFTDLEASDDAIDAYFVKKKLIN